MRKMNFFSAFLKYFFILTWGGAITNADILTLNPDNLPCQEIIEQCCQIEEEIKEFKKLIVQTHGIYKVTHLASQTYRKKDILSENEGEGEYEANIEEPSTCLFSIDEFVQYFIHRKFELHDNKISITTYSVKSKLMPILHFASMEEAAKFHHALKYMASNNPTSLVSLLYHASSPEHIIEISVTKSIEISPDDARKILKRIKHISTQAVETSTVIDYCSFGMMNAVVAPVELRFFINNEYAFSLVPIKFYHPYEGPITIIDAIELFFIEKENDNIVDAFENEIIKIFILFQCSPTDIQHIN